MFNFVLFMLLSVSVIDGQLTPVLSPALTL